MAEKITDWICICASGTSIEGELISDELIQEVADRYDTGFYTAMIWPYHPWPENGGYIAREAYTQNLGRVAELRAERDGDVLKLYARYVPNRFLAELNENDQRLFSSAEFWLDFQGQGYPYLVGVTATDIPASTHTDMIRLSAGNKNKVTTSGNFMEFSIGELNDISGNKPSIFDRLFSATRKTKPQINVTLSATDNPELEPEKVEELKKLIEAINARLDAIEASAKGNSADTPQEAETEISEAAEEIVILAEEVAALADEVAEAPEDAVVEAEFSAARAQLADKLQAFTAGNPHFATRKRRALAAFSAARKQSQASGDDTSALRNEIAELKQMVALAAGKSVTKRPTGAPGGADKKMVL